MTTPNPVINVGYKLFKEVGDEIELIRIVNVKKYKDGCLPAEVSVRNEGTGEVSKIRVDSLKEYTPLEPDGFLTFNIVSLRDSDNKLTKDIIVTASKMLNLKIGDTVPFAVCRQSITDIFYNLLCKTESDMMTGLAVNQNNCPTNFDFRYMLACDAITYYEHIHIYRTDTIKDILSMVKNLKFDQVLETLYLAHIKAVGDPSLQFKKHHKGWCRNLETLLKENNFQSDINEMLGITDVDFEISKYLMDKTLPNNEIYVSCVDELKTWLSSIFKINISECTFLEFDHDINLAEFNNSKYLLLRDNTDKLYLVVYTSDGEFLEADLTNEAKKKDFSSEFRLNFYNKYNNINK